MTKRRTATSLFSSAAVASNLCSTPHDGIINARNGSSDNKNNNKDDCDNTSYNVLRNKKSHSFISTRNVRFLVFTLTFITIISWITLFYHLFLKNFLFTSTIGIIIRQQNQPVPSRLPTTALLRSSSLPMDITQNHEDLYQIIHDPYPRYKRILGYYHEVNDERHITVHNICEINNKHNNEASNTNSRRTSIKTNQNDDVTFCIQSHSTTKKNQRQIIFDSNDEKEIYKNFFESRELKQAQPYEVDNCIPTDEWQTKNFPTCNLLHENGGRGVSLRFIKGGGYRDVWALEVPWSIHDFVQSYSNSTNDTNLLAESQSSTSTTAIPIKTIAMKTLQYRNSYTPYMYDKHRIDATIMEHLTSSQYILNVYAFCGNSIFTDFSEGGDLFKAVYSGAITSTSLRKLEVAVEVAHGLADLHDGTPSITKTTIGEDNKSDSSSHIARIVHSDFAPGQILNIDGMYKLNDFNSAQFVRKNKNTGHPCLPEGIGGGGVLRSPEEYKNEKITEKADIFSLGNTYYLMLEEHNVWRGVKSKSATIDKYIKHGIVPKIADKTYKQSETDPAIAALIKAIVEMCWPFDPKDRSSARDIANFLQNELNKIQESKNTTTSIA